MLSLQICEQLEGCGFIAEAVEDRHAVLRAVAAFRPHLILMSSSLLSASTSDFYQSIRTITRAAGLPVLLIMANPDEMNTVCDAALDADGYILKPFQIEALLVKARPLFRRFGMDFDKQPISVQNLVIDPVSHRVRRNDRNIHLSPIGYRLLEFLMRHPDRLFSRKELLDAVWGPDVPVLPRTVDVHIRRLRLSINGSGELDIVRTVREEGYALDSASA
ncbi:winged helix-turn-helix domain-containing protein [Acidisoma sp. S159]|uniref:winged helix-turn-helix domain-containing protein n=1 Tax=Acidisoma sp. S159 TaxID=1747225 RepID=UPI00131AC12A|nr:winged helix-turn-helix domain-containing protein [Acidisoma sp. S159]